MKQEIKYRANGTVLGTYKEIGELGEDSHPTVIVKGATKEDLIHNLNKMLKDGSLDYYGTFRHLIGAVLVITKIMKVWIDDKEYLRFEYDDLIIGDLTDEQIEFLKENM